MGEFYRPLGRLSLFLGHKVVRLDMDLSSFLILSRRPAWCVKEIADN